MRAIAMAALVAAALPFTAHAATEAECQTQWMAAAKDKDGFGTEQEGARYHAQMRAG